MLKIKLSKGECHYNTVSHRDKYVVEVVIPHQEEGVFIGRYKIYATPMQKQTDKNIDNIKRLDINKECSHCVADNNFTGHLDLTAYAGNILRVVFCEGQLYSAYCECILAVQPLPISIKKMWLIDDAGKKFPGNKMQGMATEPISFLPEFNRSFLQGEYLDELNCQVYSKSISSDLFEPMKMLTSNKWDRPNLVFKITVAEDHAGAVMAFSFFLNRPVNPNEQSGAPSLCYVSLVSGETMTPYIKSAVWSSKEMVKFGQASLEREEIYRNEDGFLHIETRGMYGQKVRVDLFEKDFMPPSEYLSLGSKENIPIANNVAYVPIEMSEVHSKAKRLRDFEGWEYEIIARITPDNKSIKPFDSKIINLIIDAKKPDEEAKRSTVDGSMKCVIGSAEDEKKEEEKAGQNEDMITYHIYAKGHKKEYTIEKHIPANNKHPQKYKYVYVINDDTKHIICTRTWIKVPEMTTATEHPKSIPDGYDGSKTYIYPSDSDIDAEKAYYYYDENENLDCVVVKPKKGSGIKKYTASNSAFKQILNILERGGSSLSYNKNGVKINFTLDLKQTARTYCGVDQFAVLIGVMADTGLAYTSAGCTSKDATGYPSSTHVNGFSFDFSYQQASDQALVDAMHKWAKSTNINVGKSKNTGGHITGTKLIQDKKEGGLHDSHIHWGPNNNPTIKTINIQ